MLNQNAGQIGNCISIGNLQHTCELCCEYSVDLMCGIATQVSIGVTHT